jgi:hypothetical protein
LTTGGVDLRAVAHDACVAEELAFLCRAVARDFRRVEIVECAAVVLALRENRVPRQAGLRAFENQELEQRPVVAHRDAPLAVMVGGRERVARPAATLLDCRHTVSSSATASVIPVT